MTDHSREILNIFKWVQNFMKQTEVTKEFRCRLEIDVTASDAKEAAEEAWELLHAPDCYPWIVEIVQIDGKELEKPIEIDLSADSNED